MAEKAALSLATDAAKAIGQLLKDRTIEEMQLMWGLKDELEKLKSKFSNLQLFFKDIGSAKHADKRGQVNDWLHNVKDAAYVADDIIDDYDYEIIRREQEPEKQCLKQFQDFFTVNNPIVFRIKMSRRVRDALAMFDELDKNAKNMGLKQLQITADGMAGTSANNDEGRDRLSEARQHASANATELVGRKEEMKELLEIMCRPINQEGDISTVAIRGIGGLGKTTFARCLYDSEEIGAHFEKKLWISVGDNFSILRILNEMLEYVTSSKGNLSNIDAIINKLQENLKKKKYLLVLDDVWCKDQELWSNLKNALQRIGGLPGCLILITTRLIQVATRSQAVYTHLLRALSEEEGWALLKKRVSMAGSSPNFSILEEIGKKIVEKCKGVPLALKAIGGILQSKQLPREWELIEKSEMWDLPQNDENQILPSLRLTFDHLPSPAMKQCFAYCAAFCRGYTMEKDELVSIWLAQGFLHGSEINNLTMEEIGEKYLMVLLNYSLLDEVKGEESGYKMHDLVYDLAVDVSGKDLLLWKPKDNQKVDSCRHLVIDTKGVEALSNLPITKTLRKLRTISNGLPHNVLAHAKYLRTLSVDGCEIKELPSSIGLLKHLRFLSLSDNPIKTLPDSVGKLYLLQTLRLLGCHSMEVLPKVLYTLTNLIHVPTTTSMLASRGLLELTNLHTLPRLALGDDGDGWSIDELGDLQNLMGEIHISGLEHVKTKENASKADFARKAMVSNITLAWAFNHAGEALVSEEISDEDVLDGLQPHPNIISLELKNFFGLMFPSWMMRMAVVSEGCSSSPLKNLTSLKLLNCSRCEMLPTLGHLPSLKYLFLSGLKVESIGNDFYGGPLNESNNKVNRVSFPSLTELDISEFESLKTWVLPSTGEETSVFPLLDVIQIRNCPELETIPALGYFKSLTRLRLSFVGIQSLDITKHKPSSMLSPPKENLKLEILEIDDCEKLVSLPSELQFAASLKEMRVYNCPALTYLPDDLFQGLASLHKLSIRRCVALSNIPTSLEKCASLATLAIKDCPFIEETLPTLNFQSLEEVEFENLGIRSFSIASLNVNMKLEILEIYKCEKLVSLPSELQFAASLKTLCVIDCPALTSLPDDLFQGLASLSELSICRCEALSNIPTSLEKCVSLATLVIKDCPFIEETLPTLNFQSLEEVEFENLGIRSFSIASLNVNMKLEILEIYKCEKLVSLPSELQFAASLKTLRVADCPALTSLPDDLFQGLASLSELSICRCEALSNIPTSLEKCVSLATLVIKDCPFIEETLPTLNFQSLEEVEFENLGIRSFSIASLNVNMKLEILEIYKCEKLVSLPSELQFAASLKTLRVADCPALTSLPDDLFQGLTSLSELSICRCEAIECPTPDFSNSSVNHVSFPSLIELEISNCGVFKTYLLPPAADTTNVFPRLEVLRVIDWPELETLRTLNLQSLKKVKLENLGIRSFSIASPNVNMKLETLEIYNCKKLLSLPSELQFAASLKTLCVADCPALTYLPDDLFQGLASLHKLSICRCEALSNIPTSLEKCVSLATLTIEDCPFIEETLPALNFQSLEKVELENLGIRSFSITLPALNFQSLVFNNCKKLVSLPSELQYVKSLKTLCVANCPALTSLPDDLFEGFTFLSELSICSCEALSNIPTSLEKCAFLATLTIEGCPFIEEITLPALNFQSLKKVKLENLGIRSFSIASPNANMKLEILDIYKCEKLLSLPSELQFVASLKTVKVSNCPALTSLPNDLFQGLTSLSELSICKCEALSNIPTSLEKCASLATLRLFDCPSIEGPTPDFSKLKGLQVLVKRGNPIKLMISMLKAVEHLPNLTILGTGSFNDEEEQELYFSDVSPIQQNQSLRALYLHGKPNIKSLPQQLQLLTQIKVLGIWSFDDLEELPEWVGRLSSLEELWLVGCKNLKDIPSKEVFLQMKRLRELCIKWCPFLAESCVKDDGSDWSKISHIPVIEIDFDTIQNLE